MVSHINNLFKCHHGFLVNCVMKTQQIYTKASRCLSVAPPDQPYLWYFPARAKESTTNITNTPKNEYKMSSSVILLVFSI